MADKVKNRQLIVPNDLDRLTVSNRHLVGVFFRYYRCMPLAEVKLSPSRGFRGSTVQSAA
jgi:hypothetical protein